MRGTVLAPIVVAWALSGCIPVHATVREEKAGSVVDARSGKPIANATVRVESFQVPTPPGFSPGFLVYGLDVATDVSGSWSVPAERDWKIGILAADGLPLFVDVYCVFAKGYQPAVRNPHRDWLGLPPATSDSDPTVHEIEREIRLEPASGPASPPDVSAATRCGVPL